MAGGTLILLLLNDDDSETPLEPGQYAAPIGNNGNEDIVVGQAEITGDAAAFNIVSDPVSNTTLIPGAERNIVVEAEPTTPAGLYVGTLRVPSSDPDSPLEIPLFLTVTAALTHSMTVAPTGTVDFGSADITSGAKVLPFTVSNTGTAPLVMGTVALSGSSYAKSLDGISGVTILPGMSQGLYVTFDPASIGTKTGTLTFPATGVSSVVVNLTGLGTTGAPAPDPTLVHRFYLGRQASPVAALGLAPGWGNQTTDADNLLATVKGGPAVALSAIVNHNASPGAWHRLGRWISAPLEGQTLDSTLLAYACAYRSSYLGSTVTSALRFGVLSTGGTVTWLGIKAMGAANSAWPDSTAPAPRRFPAGTPLAWDTGPITILVGERLVVELGFRCFSPSETNGARMYYGGASGATDLPATEAGTVDLTKAPWIEFTDGILVSP